MTYEEIYKSFKMETGISGDLINDYIPATKIYVGLDIPNAIVVWLHSGGSMIYTPFTEYY